MNLKTIFSLLLVIIMMIAGCTDPQNPDQNNDQKNDDIGTTGTIYIKVGDYPIENVSNVFIRFDSFTFIPLDSNMSNQTIDADNDRIDLLKLHERNLTQQIAVGEIKIGMYKELMITLKKVEIRIDNIPADITSYLPVQNVTIQNPFEIFQGQTTLAVYIDLFESLFQNENLFTFVPMVHLLYLKHYDQAGKYLEGNEIIMKNRPPIIPGIFVDEKLEYQKIVSVNQSFNLSAEAVFDIDNDPMTFVWDFDDNTTAEGLKTSHSYEKDGLYNVTLTATDGISSSQYIVIIGVDLKTDP